MPTVPVSWNGQPLAAYEGGILTPAGHTNCCCLSEWTGYLLQQVRVLWSVALNRYVEDFGTCSSGTGRFGDGRLSRSHVDDQRYWSRIEFRNVTIPQSATITSAEIELDALDLGSPTGCICDILIGVTLCGHPPGCVPSWPGENCFEYSAQQCQTAATDFWLSEMLHTACGNPTLTRDIRPILQEIVDDVDWSSGDPLVLYLLGEHQPDCEEDVDIQAVQGSGPYIVVLAANTVNASAGDKLHDELQREYQIVNIQDSLLIVSDAYGEGVPPSTGPFQAWIEYAISPTCNRPNDCISWAERGAGWGYNALNGTASSHKLRATWI